MDDKSAELAIRTRRAAFNRAIAEADLAVIGPILAKNCVMVTGSDSAVIAGRNAQLKVWRAEFAAPSRTPYVRSPDRIEVSPALAIAMEYGHWHGATLAGEVIASGSYAAKWRDQRGEWMLEAEIFVTLA